MTEDYAVRHDARMPTTEAPTWDPKRFQNDLKAQLKIEQDEADRLRKAAAGHEETIRRIALALKELEA